MERHLRVPIAPLSGRPTKTKRLPPQNKPRTHCKRGHPLVGDNLYLSSSGRACKRCKDANNVIWKSQNCGKSLANVFATKA